MKGKTLMEALGMIEERYFLSVVPMPVSKHRSRWPVAIAAAAMIGLCFFGLAGLRPAEESPITLPEYEVTTEQTKVYSETEIHQRLIEGNVSFGRYASVSEEEMKPFAHFLWEHQEQYLDYLSHENLLVSSYDMENGTRQICVLSILDHYGFVRLEHTAAGVIDCTVPEQTAWPTEGRKDIQKLLEEAPVQCAYESTDDLCRTDQEKAWLTAETAAAKAAFGQYLQSHCPADWYADSARMVINVQWDGQVSADLYEKDTNLPLVTLSYFGTTSVAALWYAPPEQNWEIDLHFDGTERMTLSEVLQALYAADPQADKPFLAWFSDRSLPLPAGCGNEDLVSPAALQSTLEAYAKRFGSQIAVPKSETPITWNELDKLLREITGDAAYKTLIAYPDGQICPEELMTRSEFTKTLLAAMNLTPDSPMTQYLLSCSLQQEHQPFTDLDNHWFTTDGWTEIAVKTGIVVPADYEGMRLEPNAPITRIQCVVQLIRAMGLVQEANADIPRDTVFEEQEDFPDWMVGYAVEAAEKGIAEKNIHGYFNADETLRRGEAVAMIQQAMVYTRQGLGENLPEAERKTILLSGPDGIEPYDGPYLLQDGMLCVSLTRLCEIMEPEGWQYSWEPVSQTATVEHENRTYSYPVGEDLDGKRPGAVWLLDGEVMVYPIDLPWHVQFNATTEEVTIYLQSENPDGEIRYGG